MASTYSNLKIQLMATGENTTTWGDVTNINLGTAIEEAIAGSADVTFASANVTLTLTNTNTTQAARNMRLRCTGTTGGSTRNLVVPSIEKPYVVQNDCADSILVKTSAGTGVTVPAGKTMWLYVDGVNVVEVVNYLTSPTFGAALPIAQGGTGANTASDARTNLGLGSLALQAANNVAITGGSIVGITDLAVADGGTGASDASAARTNLGLGTISTQNANNINISGGAISGVTLSTTGTPTAPTASPGTNNTQIATTAFVQTALQALYPVGSVYINASSTTNPATLLGFGTWVEIGAGRVLVGQNTGDAAFDTLGETGGSKDATLVSHQHGFSGSTSWAALSGSVDFASSGIPNYSTSGIISQFGTANQGQFGSGTVPGGFTVDASHSHSVSGATDWQGSSATNANLQPYVVVKMWQRTA